VPSGQTSPEQIPLKGTAEVYALSKAFRDMVTELDRLKAQEKEAQDRHSSIKVSIRKPSGKLFEAFGRVS